TGALPVPGGLVVGNRAGRRADGGGGGSAHGGGFLGRGVIDRRTAESPATERPVLPGPVAAAKEQALRPAGRRRCAAHHGTEPTPVGTHRDPRGRSPRRRSRVTDAPSRRRTTGRVGGPNGRKTDEIQDSAGGPVARAGRGGC